MRALYIERHGGPEVLALREEADPTPGPGQVLVDAHRAGLNFSDLAARMGLYPDAPKPPMVSGYEVSGTVLALGEGVSHLSVGQRVLAVPPFGGQSNRVVLSSELVVPIPAAMSFDQAAAIPVNYLTAYHLLFHIGRLRPGDRLLLHMAAGGVGMAVLDLCRQVKDVEVFGTASTVKHDLLRKVGVAHPIDPRTTDVETYVRAQTHGRGVELVLDAVGGPSWAMGYRLLAPAGQLIAFGWSAMVAGQKRSVWTVARQFLGLRRYSPMQLMNDNRTVSGVNMGHLWGERQLLRSHLAHLLDRFEQGQLSPHIDRVFPLSQGAAAHRYVHERRNVGKVLFDCTC